MTLTPVPQHVLVEASQAAYSRRRDVALRLRHTPNTDLLALFTTYRRTNPDLGAMRVRTVLTALPGISKSSARRLLEDLDLDGSRRMRQLGTRQARNLAERLDTSYRTR